LFNFRPEYISGFIPPTTTTYQRRATPLYDYYLVTAGIHYAPTTAREQSRGCKTSYI